MADRKVEKNEIIHDNLIYRVFEIAACDSEISIKKIQNGESKMAVENIKINYFYA